MCRFKSRLIELWMYNICGIKYYYNYERFCERKKRNNGKTRSFKR